VFLDSAVSGLDWSTSAGATGTTGADGRFRYLSGGTVLFSIGDVVLGVASGAAVVTPVDLVSGATDETDEAVINLARFLQTLDLDQDADNGIVLAESVRQAALGVSIDFTQSVAAFEAGEQAAVAALTAGLPGGARPLIPAQDARDHLASTLRRIVAGRYDGRYGGDSSGSFSVFVDRDGALFGWALDAFDGLLSLSGSAATDRGFVAGDASSGATFTGAIEPDGSLGGSWQLLPDTGTFDGDRSVALADDLDLDLIALLAGTYVGTSSTPSGPEPFTAELDADGNLTQPPPEDHLAGAIVSTSGTGASFLALSDEGDVIRGNVQLAGTFSGTFRNEVTGESGTFTGARQ
jgi:hypothetical protein